MTRLHVLHVDDEPDIREVAAMSLELDPTMSLTSAASAPWPASANCRATNTPRSSS